MTSCRLDDAAECNVARVTVGGPRVAVLATRGATCVGYPSSPAAPSSRGPRILSSVRHNSDTGPPGIGEIIILYLPRFSISLLSLSLSLSLSLTHTHTHTLSLSISLQFFILLIQSKWSHFDTLSISFVVFISYLISVS